MIDKYGRCPKCGDNWDAGDIYEVFLDKKKNGDPYWKKQTDAEIRAIVKKCYGPPYRFSRLIAINDQRLDCVVSFMCPACETKWDRETGKEI